jgi:hypothetical protein
MAHEVEFDYVVWAFGLGTASAISLPLGALAAIWWRPSKKMVGALMAFGGGALLSALSIELVAPHATALAEGNVPGNHSIICESPHTDADPVWGYISLLLGMIVGGFLFVLLDEIINANGGFLRKHAVAMMYIQRRKEDRIQELVDYLSQVDFLKDKEISSQQIENVLDDIHYEMYHDREVIYERGERANRIFLVKTGQVGVIGPNKSPVIHKTGEFVGEFAVLTGDFYDDTATAIGDVEAWSMLKSVFDEIPLENAMTKCNPPSEEIHLLDDDENEDGIQKHQILKSKKIEKHEIDFLKERENAGGSPMAIWLGILLDGIPESFIIGSEMYNLVLIQEAQGEVVTFGSVIPYTLIAGLFLSNFPEALSSSQVSLSFWYLILGF